MIFSRGSENYSGSIPGLFGALAALRDGTASDGYLIKQRKRNYWLLCVFRLIIESADNSARLDCRNSPRRNRIAPYIYIITYVTNPNHRLCPIYAQCPMTS